METQPMPVRAALGQLFAYRYFLHERTAPPRLMALFSEPVGDEYVAFLEAHEIASVWWEHSAWQGSPTAQLWRLATRQPLAE